MNSPTPEPSSRSPRDLKRDLKGLARTRSVEDLQKRGIKQVKIASLDHILELVQEAVQRTAAASNGSEDLADASRREFARLLRNHRDLQRDQQQLRASKARADRELAKLKAELDRNREALETQRAASEAELEQRHRNQDAMVNQRVEGLLDQITSTDRGAAKEQVVQLVMDIVGTERATAARDRKSAHDHKVHQLERRVAKLMNSLEQTEAALRQTAQGEAGDLGIASIYRDVQGLDATSPFATRRRELMANIFEANVELQQAIAS